MPLKQFSVQNCVSWSTREIGSSSFQCREDRKSAMLRIATSRPRTTSSYLSTRVPVSSSSSSISFSHTTSAMPLSTFVKELSDSERRLQLKGQCLKRFIIRRDGSADEQDPSQRQGRVTQDHVLSLKGFCLTNKQTNPFPDQEAERTRYWSVTREYLKDQDWIRESEQLPVVANADTFSAIMLMPFQSVPQIHAWKDNDVIFLMKAKGRDVNAVKHNRVFDKERHQKLHLIRHLTKTEQQGQAEGGEKWYKISKVSLGEETLISVSETEALDENENEVRVCIRRDFEEDEKKRDKFYRYSYPRLVTSAAVRQISSLILVTKDADDCVKDAMCLHKIKQMMNEVRKSPKKITWSLQKSVTFLHRFLYLMREEMDDAEDHVVYTFTKDKDKRSVVVKKEEDFDSSRLTGAEAGNENEDLGEDDEDGDGESDGEQEE